MQNRQSKLKLASALLVTVFITGCSSQKFSNEELSTGIGAGLGGLLGSALTNDNIIITLASTAVGAYIGNNMGKDMDQQNEKKE
jgi:hypothetical protein